MDASKKIELDFSKLYGFKLVEVERKAAMASKVGHKGPSARVLFSSKIGAKEGIKVPQKPAFL